MRDELNQNLMTMILGYDEYNKPIKPTIGFVYLLELNEEPKNISSNLPPCKKWYKFGHTNNLERRLAQHKQNYPNSKYVKFWSVKRRRLLERKILGHIYWEDDFFGEYIDLSKKELIRLKEEISDTVKHCKNHKWKSSSVRGGGILLEVTEELEYTFRHVCNASNS